MSESSNISKIPDIKKQLGYAPVAITMRIGISAFKNDERFMNRILRLFENGHGKAEREMQKGIEAIIFNGLKTIPTR